jgi:hypothetical protein
MDIGGWLWVVIDVIAVAVLAGALIYGGSMWARRRRDPAIRQAQERATRELYQKERSDIGDRPPPPRSSAPG